MSRPADPLAGSTWSAPGTVAGFEQSLPNPTLVVLSAARADRHERVELGAQ